MYSSVYFSRNKSKIHYWEYEGDKKVYKTEKAPLYFFMKDEKGEYISIYGDKLKKVDFETFESYKNAKEMFKSSNVELFESDIATENRFILDQYSDKEIVIPKYDIFFIDIEVHSTAGFPYPEKAEYPIPIITVYSTKQKKYFIFAEKEFDTSFLPKGTFVKTFNNNESELLKYFISFIRKSHPDVLSGFNSNPFDIPYIINRCYKLLGEEITNKISPINQVRKVIRKTRWRLPFEIYQIKGINCIDYLELYRKYEPGERESYKLDFIAEFELGVGKVKYEGSLSDLYTNNWQKYCEYNFGDVELLVKLDDYKQFFNLMFTICCNCRVPFEQYDKTVRVLDGAFISKLRNDKTILPDAKQVDELSDEKYEGAFVFPTIPGAYDWVVSFDATSLYPSIMSLHNISPETKVCTVNRNCVDLIFKHLNGNNLSDDEYSIEAYGGKTIKDILDIIKNNKYSISSNGVLYRHDKIGVVASFVNEWFDKRQFHKKLMKKAANENNLDEEAKQNGLQYNYKILINSVYGYLGTKYSRFYDVDNAEAVTKTGQICIKNAMDSVNDFFTKKWESSEIGKKIGAKNTSDLIIGGDTDSIFLNCGEILKSFNYKHYNDMNLCKKFLDEKIIKLIDIIIDKNTKKLTEHVMNAPKNKIFFKREMIARSAVYICKKNYVAWVVNNEGADKDITDPDDCLKAKGIEMAKSTASKMVRNLMKEFIFDLLHHFDYVKANTKLNEIAIKFKNLNLDYIAKIGNIKEFNKYLDSNGVPFEKGPTSAAKASAGYNLLLKSKNLLNKYPEIREGDKIKIIDIKTDCPFYKYDVIAFKDTLPKEFGLHDYIDYDIIYNKVLEKPILRFYTALNWQIPNFEQEDITDLFN